MSELYTPPAPSAAPAAGRAPVLTPLQRRVFDDLLGIGLERPTMSPGLPERLQARILAATEVSLGRWTENRYFLTKSQLMTVLRCEGQALADSSSPRGSKMIPAVAVGNVAHRAIQLASTHPGRPAGSYVDAAVAALLDSDRGLSTFWHSASMASQSDLVTQAVSKTVGFLDSFPPLRATWVPRFEEPMQAKVGKLVLSARADLTLGRPRGDGRQTMVLIDFKSSGLQDHHLDEAMFYALVSTLRNGVAPYRSFVFSLSSGEWTEPDVTEASLVAAADRVIQGANALVDLLTERREPTYTPGRWCTWCPARESCSVSTFAPVEISE